jgi:hypothetical protein
MIRERLEITRLRTALMAAEKYVQDDMAENAARVDGKDMEILQVIRDALKIQGPTR